MCLQVSAWLCTVMAAAFFTANLATEKLQGSLYVNFILTSMGGFGHIHTSVCATSRLAHGSMYLLWAASAAKTGSCISQQMYVLRDALLRL
jgi:hypothetical protein